jgi:hypothetical protein
MCILDNLGRALGVMLHGDDNAIRAGDRIYCATQPRVSEYLIPDNAIAWASRISALQDGADRCRVTAE